MNIKALLLFIVCLLPFSAFAQEAEESPFYGQVMLHDYHDDNGTFFAQESYFQVENDNGVAVWVMGYRDSEFWSASVGLAKTWDNGWTVALGGGEAHAYGLRTRVVAPWVSYSSENWELLLSGEWYGDYGTYYQGYLQRRFGDHHAVGIYGETGFGIGPVLTLGANDHVAFRVAIPVAAKGDTSVLASLVLTF